MKQEKFTEIAKGVWQTIVDTAIMTAIATENVIRDAVKNLCDFFDILNDSNIKQLNVPTALEKEPVKINKESKG
ncbi:MAG: hypothetical protein JXA60_05615 [Candidatus Coatesbacteria bacterium]|nr:hypothetical protein [Candidatus Coatesbacteria bacterium]